MKPPNGPTASRAAPNRLADAFDPEAITTKGDDLPDRILVYAPPKWGKTSFAAQADNCLFLMSQGEDGLKTLMRTGQLPPTRHFPQCCESWLHARKAVNGLLRAATRPRHLVLDTFNGFERLLFEWKCNSEFDGNWLKFDMFEKGQKLSAPEWADWLKSLDLLRQMGTGIIALCHTSTEKVKNNDGDDYLRAVPAMNQKYIWPICERWPDIILQGVMEVQVKTEKNQAVGKAFGGDQRILRCEPGAAHVAGNRHGLPPEIECGDSPAAAWNAFQNALKGGDA